MKTQLCSLRSSLLNYSITITLDSPMPCELIWWMKIVHAFIAERREISDWRHKWLEDGGVEIVRAGMVRNVEEYYEGDVLILLQGEYNSQVIPYMEEGSKCVEDRAGLALCQITHTHQHHLESTVCLALEFLWLWYCIISHCVTTDVSLSTFP